VKQALVTCVLVLLLAPLRSRAEETKKFELADGDRVVLVGNTFIEREQYSGYIETMLTTRYPNKNITFRNLGWSGDTVYGTSRAVFGTPADGFKALTQWVNDLKPTVILVGYGMNESFDGEAGLPNFLSGLNAMLDMLAATKARIVIISPIKHEQLPPPLPDAAEHNKNLALYVDAQKKVATERGYPFADLYANLGTGNELLTDNGIHLTPHGYSRAAVAVAKQLGLPAEPDIQGAKWEKLRQTIVAKNELFFRRFRPQNDTYIYLFRKKEQGKNAVEIPMFDPLIAEKEVEIAKLRVQ